MSMAGLDALRDPYSCQTDRCWVGPRIRAIQRLAACRRAEQRDQGDSNYPWVFRYWVACLVWADSQLQDDSLAVGSYCRCSVDHHWVAHLQNYRHRYSHRPDVPPRAYWGATSRACSWKECVPWLIDYLRRLPLMHDRHRRHPLMHDRHLLRHLPHGHHRRRGPTTHSNTTPRAPMP